MKQVHFFSIALLLSGASILSNDLNEEQLTREAQLGSLSHKMLELRCFKSTDLQESTVAECEQLRKQHAALLELLHAYLKARTHEAKPLAECVQQAGETTALILVTEKPPAVALQEITAVKTTE